MSYWLFKNYGIAPQGSADYCVNDVLFVPTVTVLTVPHILIVGYIKIAPQLFPHDAEVLIFSIYGIKKCNYLHVVIMRTVNIFVLSCSQQFLRAAHTANHQESVIIGTVFLLTYLPSASLWSAARTHSMQPI